MCTVTFIPSGNDIFLTANRDEQRERPPALPPVIYRMNGREIVFPKDTRAGGTWFAINENGNGVVFLNGALENHVHQPPYRKSRGLILLDLLSGLSAVAEFDKADLNHIEPFTAIITEGRKLYICRWNGSSKSRYKLNENLPYIWSSVTLYDPLTIEKRQQWFTSWISKNPNPSLEEIMHFHQHTGDGDSNNDLMMNRDNKLFTHSISAARISENFATFHYLDLPGMESTDSSIRFLKAIPVNA